MKALPGCRHQRISQSQLHCDPWRARGEEARVCQVLSVMSPGLPPLLISHPGEGLGWAGRGREVAEGAEEPCACRHAVFDLWDHSDIWTECLADALEPGKRISPAFYLLAANCVSRIPKSHQQSHIQAPPMTMRLCYSRAGEYCFYEEKHLTKCWIFTAPSCSM